MFERIDGIIHRRRLRLAPLHPSHKGEWRETGDEIGNGQGREDARWCRGREEGGERVLRSEKCGSMKGECHGVLRKWHSGRAQGNANCSRDTKRSVDKNRTLTLCTLDQARR